MSLRRSTPLAVNPRGLSDALDGSNVFSGAMASLQNLIPDPSTKALWQARPASSELIDLTSEGGGFSSGFSSGFQIGFATGVGLVSCMKVVGTYVFGLVASATNPGHDQPFVYNIVADALVVITGVTAANTPVSPAATGAWTPPTMDLVGTNLLVTHPGFSGTGNVWFGWFDIADLNAITWNGGNLTGAITFSTVPSAVKNFNGRAYWLVNPATGQPSAVYSDVLLPRTVTNANQALTFDDNTPLTALGGLGLDNQLGGQIQALIVFKGVTNMYQVTGDAATSNLAKNALNVATGTLAPLSLASTKNGLMFAAPDGLRLIDFGAHVSDPIGVDGMGKTLPFIYSVVPSRMVAAANGSVYRITVQDGSLVTSPWREYWYDIPRGIWSGPHTFPASCISAYSNTFIVAPRDVEGSLWQSDYVQNSTSSFTENGAIIQFNYTTVMLPDTNQMCENAMVETTLYMALASATNYTIYAQNQDGAILQTAQIAATGTTTIWGAFQWGQAVWGGSANNLYPRQIPWPEPVVFRRMQIAAIGACSAALRIGTLHMRYEQLGYLQQQSSAA